MQVPFSAVSKFAHPLIGIVETTLEKAETGVEVTEDKFSGEIEKE
jgi:hypothetical protein